MCLRPFVDLNHEIILLQQQWHAVCVCLFVCVMLKKEPWVAGNAGQ